MNRVDLATSQVICWDDVLGDRDCADILDALAFAWWWPSELVRVRRDGHLTSTTSDQRTSETTSEAWMSDDVLSVLRRLETVLFQRLGLRPDHLEQWQASRYRRGRHFAEHHDAGFFASSPDGERTHTVVVYLEDHVRGGALVFPRLDVRFRPQAGRMLVWRDLLDDGTIDPRMRHAALPALRTKTILTTWARQGPIRQPSQE